MLHDPSDRRKKKEERRKKKKKKKEERRKKKEDTRYKIQDTLVSDPSPDTQSIEFPT